MKANIILILLLLITSTVYSQFSANDDIKGSFKVLQLENEDIKYMKYDSKSKTLNLLNQDHSTWKSISLTIPEDHFLDEVKLVSKNVFNGDDQVEVLYTTIKYDYSNDYEAPATFDKFTAHSLKLVDENGKILLNEEPCIIDYEIIKSNEANYLYVHKNRKKGFKSEYHSVVYTLAQ